MEVDMVADSLADMLADMEVKYEFIAEETTIQKSQTGKQWLLTTHSLKNSYDLVGLGQCPLMGICRMSTHVPLYI